MTTIKLYIPSPDNMFHCDVYQDGILNCSHTLSVYDESLTLERNTFNVANRLAYMLCIPQDKLEVPVRMACLLKNYSFSFPSL